MIRLSAINSAVEVCEEDREILLVGILGVYERLEWKYWLKMYVTIEITRKNASSNVIPVGEDLSECRFLSNRLVEFAAGSFLLSVNLYEMTIIHTATPENTDVTNDEVSDVSGRTTR